eukprot:GHVT01042952.1.p2 GENE.GHVT01042952.1~~GHVT01042952.1.p2  ORF type:complete len:116 (-),score=22.22 GHVT01042952.1:95-442(-)
MVWPVIALGVGVSALLARSALRAGRSLQHRVPALDFSKIASAFTASRGRLRELKGFEANMSATEAYRILAVPPTAPRERIVQAHKQLMLRNHPDNGGSTYLATKVNEAKEFLTKN